MSATPLTVEAIAKIAQIYIADEHHAFSRIASAKRRARNYGFNLSLFLQGIRTLSYYEIRVWPDCGRPQLHYVKRFLRGLSRERIFCKPKPREKNG
jgi:hypothetical protein